MLTLPDAWVWDFWLADDGRSFHLYYLQAPRGDDPESRHWNVSVGHAVSTDLTAWTVLADAIAPASGPAFDDLTTWTGSVVQGPDGVWFMFYTGGGSREQGLKQRVGLATSADLVHWTKHPASPVLESDPRWYEQYPDAGWADEAWRDPWVFPDPDGRGWHMLVTARSRLGTVDQRGVIGHAISPDLVHWEAAPPLSHPGAGFGQLEVSQVEVIEGRPVLIFSCLGAQLSRDRREAGEPGGIWCLPADSLLGPFDVARAVRLTDESVYSGRLIRDRSGQWVMLAFRNNEPGHGFVGELIDPVPVGWSQDGTTLVEQFPEGSRLGQDRPPGPFRY